MSRPATRAGSQTGFPVVQALIVAVIAVIVVAIAVPVYAARAKESVLRQNAATLELEVKSYLVSGLEATRVASIHTVADAEPNDEHSASEIIAQALVGPGPGISPYYVNPINGSRAVVYQTASPLTAGDSPPAVWVTDDQRLAYGAFTASPSTKSRFGGTLMVVFITRGGVTSGVEIFYVDAAGERSPTATTLAISE